MEMEDIQIEPVGGNKFDPIVTSLDGTLPGSKDLTAIGITRDADVSFSNMLTSVQNTLRKANLPVPPNPCELAGTDLKTSIFIFPDNESDGALENLCLESVNEDPAIECVDDFFSCLEQYDARFGSEHPHPFKARLQVYLAKEEEGDIHMGIAAEKGVWNWDHPAFNDVKAFLIALYS